MTPSKETRRAEGRGQPGRNPGEEGQGRTQSRITLPSNLARVNAAARAAVQTRFTALLHHIDTGLIRDGRFIVKPKSRSKKLLSRESRL